MNSKIDRYRELGALILAAQSEIDTLEIDSIKYYESELEPAGLDDHITNLKRQITAWKSEQKSLFRYIADEEETASMSTADYYHILDYLKPEKPGKPLTKDS